MNPAVAGDTAAVMSAVRATDDSKWVEYSFTCTSLGGHNSGWISSNRWTDCMLKPGRTYSYTVKMRDKYGNETAESAPMSVAIPRDTDSPAPEFLVGPIGISASAIMMTAKKAEDACGLVEYQFTRNDGKKSGWQSSRNWTDKDLAEGSEHSYTVEARDGWGNTGKASAAKSAAARDDTPPAQYKLGEWQSLPYSTLDNCVAMRAMSVTDKDGGSKIEDGDVEYFFHCVSGDGPDSGWIGDPFYKTAIVPDGKYTYQFKIRDKSPQKNETKYSTEETATVSNITGYHEYPLDKVAGQPEGVLVSFKGKVTAVDADYYTLSNGDASVKVMPRTVASKTDPALKDKDVTVKGCVWTCTDEKRVTWAELQ
jgi:hypothetical protein